MAGVPGGNLLGQIFKVFGFAGGVGDDVEDFRAKTCYDCIIYYASGGRVKEAGEG